jgi:hypothetical protein
MEDEYASDFPIARSAPLPFGHLFGLPLLLYLAVTEEEWIDSDAGNHVWAVRLAYVICPRSARHFLQLP